MPTLDTTDLFDATICTAVVEGTCVVLVEGINGQLITYAGPIGSCPTLVDHPIVLFNEKDFERLRAHVKSKQH